MVTLIALAAIGLVLFGSMKDKQELIGDATNGDEIPFPLVSGVLMKPGVLYSKIKPQTVRAITAIRDAMNRLGFGPVVITSLEDGSHLPTSFHYKGLAVDVRTRHLSLAQSSELTAAVRAELGNEYDVLNEGIGPGYDRQSVNHLHTEFDP